MTVCLLPPPVLTKGQIQASIDVKTLLNTAADCLRFVTEFFEVISKSGPHLYHSALQLVPHSSVVWKLYGHQIYSPLLKVVTGVPGSWDSCTASTRTAEVYHAAWSPCGQFVAAAFKDIIQIHSSTTLERISVLKPPSHLLDVVPIFLTFSPDGHLLACSYGQ